jgi:hypothetical protein
MKRQTIGRAAGTAHKPRSVIVFIPRADTSAARFPICATSVTQNNARVEPNVMGRQNAMSNTSLMNDRLFPTLPAVSMKIAEPR